MDLNCLGLIKDYADVLTDMSEKGFKSLSQYKDYLKEEKDMATGSLQRRLNLIGRGETPFYYCNDDEIMFDKRATVRFLSELAHIIGLKWERDEIFPCDEDDALKSEAEKLRGENKSLTDKVTKQEAEISSLQKELEEAKKVALKNELERKVLVSSSIKVGPKKESMDDIFLNDVERLLDVEKCVVKYGGELDSFYEEIKTDNKDDKGFEPGRELTHRNHCLRIMKRIGTKEFFKKRVKDNQEAKKIEERVGQLFPNHGGKKTEWQKERDRILRNRFMSVNSILQNSDLTNQEKLIMYAMNGEYHNTNIERLLVFAAQHCIHADFLIYILEDPDVCTTYENTVGFLDQFANASEFRMKLNLARELIDGKWYITADYNGKDTKFQLVPIDEFNELRRAAGLPESKFTYKNKDDKKEESKEEVKKEEEEPVEKPEFVERSQVSSQKVDIPDDGFEPYKDKENTEEEVPEEPDLPFN